MAGSVTSAIKTCSRFGTAGYHCETKGKISFGVPFFRGSADVLALCEFNISQKCFWKILWVVCSKES